MSDVLSPATETAAAPPATAEAPAPARPRFRWKPALAALALVAAGAAAGAGVMRALPPPGASEKSAGEEKKPEGGDSLAFPKEKQSAAGVEVSPVEARPLAVVAWRTGRLAFNEDRVAHVSPPADGIVRAVPVAVGQTVEPGAVLAVIDCREFGLAKLELAKARVALDIERHHFDRTKTTTANAVELLGLLEAETPLAEVEKRMEKKPVGELRAQLLGAYAKRNQARVELASARASAGTVSGVAVRKAEAEASAAAAAYTALIEELRYEVKHQIHHAELKLREAEVAADAVRGKLMTFGLSGKEVDAVDAVAEGERASLLPVKAPFRGTVVEKHVVPSERIDPKTQLFVLADLSSVWVQADVFEADLPLVRGLTGKPIKFRSSVAGVPERTAEVVYTGDLIDRSSRAMTLTAKADNADRALKPGMFVEVGFDLTDSTDVLQVPVTAVLRHENRPFVFVATGDETFARREVALGRTAGDWVEVTEGLRRGERVVVRGGFVLKSEMLKDQMVGD
jgi:multidrug efflux pump subunit AcrA (membrane-fusion protein)